MIRERTESRPKMWTLAELPNFRAGASKFWSNDELNVVYDEIARQAPEGDDLIPHSNGCWKSRKAITGGGKSGGARLIYYIDTKQQRIILLAAYRKSELGNIPGQTLAKLVRSIV